MSNGLKDLVEEIQFRKKWTVAQVAESIGYSRVHLTREYKKQGRSELEDLLLAKHGKMLQNVSHEKIKEEHLSAAGVNITLADYIAEIKQQKQFLQELLSQKMSGVENRLTEIRDALNLDESDVTSSSLKGSKIVSSDPTEILGTSKKSSSKISNRKKGTAVSGQGK